ncbi:MAG TPA: SulP family inorganic anion transporter [Streptosporangiaceae bacterium]|nr:SulP family inorganic anion transporter [Streptosporangiaceae bacterium]
MKIRVGTGRETLGKDAVAGLVLGVESVPDGLAAGLLAGVSPLSGLYAYMFGTIGGSLFTSSTFMAVQATSAMSIIVADVPAVHSAGDQERALFTLSVLTGIVMLAAGFLRLGYALRFVSNSVLTGFMSAVGVNIIFGQLANLTGYKASGANRIIRALNTLLHPGQLHLQSLAVGVLTIVLILVFERTRLGPLGLVLAVILTSAGVALLGWDSVATVGELGAIPRSLPAPVAPVLGLVPSLVIPALSLAFVGLVQGAAISAAFPNPGGASPDASRDFIGQGAANVIAGTFRGMPVGGSTSATALNKAAGARSRLSLLIAGVVMAVVVLAFAGLVGHVAMPALAGLLILIGYRTVKPHELWSVWKTGVIQKTVLATSFALTMLIPLQYAVLAGVGLSMVLHVVRQSNQVTIKRQYLDPDGHLIEADPPAELPAGEVVVLQPYGSLFFAAAPAFEAQLPAPAGAPGNSVVILRVRGRTDLGTTFMQVLCRYGTALASTGSKLVIESAGEQLQEQLRTAGVTDVVGPDNIYRGNMRVGATLKRAYADATAWISDNQHTAGTETP